MRKLWLARNKEGLLKLYSGKPIKDEERGIFKFNERSLCMFFNTFDYYRVVKIKDTRFPEVTWENSPVEVTVNIKTKK